MTAKVSAQFSENKLHLLDSMIYQVMDSLKIPGLQIAITQGDSLKFIRGYGVSDLQRQIRVDPYASTFQIGSITKMFTAMALQHAANQGELSLDKDISNYLDYEFERIPGDTISLNDLLSHSSGLDEIWYDGGAKFHDPAGFETHIKKVPIRQVRRSGHTFNYSNIGINLAAYILSKQTDTHAYRYYEDIIIKPLGLNNTGVSLDPDRPNYPPSYYLLGDSLEMSPHSRSNLYASGHVYSTAEDMSKLMRALLNHGQLDSTHQLTTDLFQQIASPRFMYKEHPVYGSGLGIFITDTNKGKVYSHLGFVDGFASSMYLFKNEKVGLFVSANSQMGTLALQDLVLFFLKTFLPQYKSDPVTEIPNSAVEEKLIGNYIPVRFPETTIGKIQSLFVPVLRFETNSEGHPQIRSGNKVLPLVQQKKDVFLDTTRFVHKSISFNTSEKEIIMNYAVDKGIYGIWPYKKLSWYEERIVQYPLRIVSLLLFAIVPIIWLVQAIRFRSRREFIFRKVWLSIAMISSAIGFGIFVYAFLDFERLNMLSVEQLPWQINAYAIFNGISAMATLLYLVLTLKGRRHIKVWHYILLFLLLLNIINNYLYNSFSMITY